jgi:hypothetical protein
MNPKITVKHGITSVQFVNCVVNYGNGLRPVCIVNGKYTFFDHLPTALAFARGQWPPRH